MSVMINYNLIEPMYFFFFVVAIHVLALYHASLLYVPYFKAPSCAINIIFLTLVIYLLFLIEQTRISACESSPCQNEAACADNDDVTGYTCFCRNGYTGNT